MMLRRRLLPLLTAVILAVGPAWPGLAAAASTGVTVDTSLGNRIATGAVTNADPAAARMTVSNRYHFWAGLDLQPAVGGARLAPAALGEDARGLYGLIRLIGPEATSAWSGTFDPAGGSQGVWVHYDLATDSGAAALALTCLTIVADTFGAPLLAPSAAAVQAAITLLTDLDEFTDLMAAVQRNDTWGIAQQWSLLLQSQAGRDAIRLALSKLGVVVTDGALRTLGSVVGLVDFARTMLDLTRAGLGGHTSGLVTFAYAGGGVAASAGTATPVPTAVGISGDRTDPREAAQMVLEAILTGDASAFYSLVLPGQSVNDGGSISFGPSEVMALQPCDGVPVQLVERPTSSTNASQVLIDIKFQRPCIDFGRVGEAGSGDSLALVFEWQDGRWYLAGLASSAPPTPVPTLLVTTVPVASDIEGAASGPEISTAETITVEAIGTWCTGGIKPDGSVSCGGPEGIRWANPDETDVLLPSAQIGSLIGRIGDGPWFLIGGSTQFMPDRSGVLLLACNDRAGYYADNRGAVHATITIAPP